MSSENPTSADNQQERLWNHLPENPQRLYASHLEISIHAGIEAKIQSVLRGDA